MLLRPGAGAQGMQFFEFIFLRRNWGDDEKVVRRTLMSYKVRAAAPPAIAAKHRAAAQPSFFPLMVPMANATLSDAITIGIG